jgi:hypothetical protein
MDASIAYCFDLPGFTAVRPSALFTACETMLAAAHGLLI